MTCKRFFLSEILFFGFKLTSNLNLIIQLMMFFFLFLVLSLGVASASPSLFSMWLWLELMTLFFYPIMYYYSPISGSMITWKYYITQTISSVMFLLFMIMENKIGGTIFLYLMIASLLIKLGLHPFHGWSIHMCESGNWLSLTLLGSVMKIGPLIILSKLSEDLGGLFIFFLMVGLVMSSLHFFQKSSIRWMMMFSSIFNINWASLGACQSMSSLFFYLFTYFFTLLIFFFILSKEGNSYSSTFFNSTGVEKSGVLILLSLAMFGLPPMGTFFGKVDIGLELVNNYPELAVLYVCITSIVSFFYMKFAISMSLFTPNKKFEWFSSQTFLSMFIWSWVVFLLVYMN